MSFITIKGQDFYYEVKGTGQPLVLISGFTADHSVWGMITGPLSERYSVLTFDNRVVGQSSSPDYPYSMELLAEDTVTISQRVFGQKVHVIGHSMGGAIVQTMAHKHSQFINKAIVANTFPFLNEAFLFVCKLQLEMREQGIPQDLIDKLTIPWVFSSRFLSNHDLIFEILSSIRKTPFPQTLIGYRNQMNALTKFNSMQWLPEISLPMGIIAGEADLISTLEESRVLASLIPHSKLMIMKGVGHAGQIEKPLEFVETVLTFLN